MRAIYPIISVTYLEPLLSGTDLYYRFTTTNLGLVIKEEREFDDEYTIKKII